MVVGRDKVNVHFFGFNVRFHHFLAFIVCGIEDGLVSTSCEVGENIGEGGNHGSIVLGWHSANKDGVEVINVCN